jgi:DNA-binding MarR family transcriptional regulator
MSNEVELLTEIRDLLQIIAEPEIAKRDAKLRASLRSTVGESEKKARAVMLMDGSRLQSAIAKEVKIDPGDLSRLVKALTAANVVSSSEKHPKLLTKIPPTFFDGADGDEF